MKALCFSDSHGISYYMEAAIGLHPDTQVVFFLGDGLSDVESVLKRNPGLACLCVRGNCDFSKTTFDREIQKTDEIKLLGKRFVFTHGDLYGVKYGIDGITDLARSRGADVLLFGHTHTPFEKYIPTSEGGIYLFNPGSIGGKNIAAPTYGIINIGESGVLLSHGSFT